ncbi:AbrB/MazE/SpoVT family DNA-binding domain-containing protein [Ruminococcus sp. Marseille-P6503]|uniref:AbrB/MazE/SpoVT family DNA-binding domain-containing protein n=1 Tax=Ruminococcus sp. Marseille-P6503 TaxID=2364796 RepID=UPI000F5381F9|nr:AbrB/MazE/SpoVT family DNA-binding domain-containing protein [Ruminococcus sp. Marseille-P6503]
MMIKHKKLTSKAAVTIPKDLRLSAGFGGGMAVDLIERDDGILIRKHVPVCRYCGSVEDVLKIRQDEICCSCAAAIAAEISQKLAGKETEKNAE